MKLRCSGQVTPDQEFILLGQVVDDGTLFLGVPGAFEGVGRIVDNEVTAEFAYTGVLRLLLQSEDQAVSGDFTDRELQQASGRIVGERIVGAPRVLEDAVLPSEPLVLDVPGIGDAPAFQVTLDPDGSVRAQDSMPSTMGDSAVVVTALSDDRLDLVGHVYLEGEPGGQFLVSLVLSSVGGEVSIQGSYAIETHEVLQFLLSPLD